MFRKKKKSLEKGKDTPRKKVEAALEAGFASVQTEKEAAQVLEQLERTARGLAQDQTAPVQDAKSAAQSAQEIEKIVEAAPKAQKAAAAFSETAKQIVREPAEKEVGELDEGIARAARKSELPREVRRGRRLLRKQLFRRLRPLQALDALAFVQINDLPHPPKLDRAMSRFSWIMTGGHAWAVVIIFDALCDRRHAGRAAAGILPALWLTTFTVEQGIKRFFRRRRPFISIVRAIVVGRKPGSFSFPSGHSAAAFAGATLLAIYYPRGANFFRVIATLVAFARVYLGAHYPGDVISGGLSGVLLARLYRSLFLCLFRRKGCSGRELLDAAR